GAELVLSKVSAAPGFWIGNVIVMAGVPSIMQAMLDYVAPKLATGAKMLSETVRADAREGDVGSELGAVAKAHPDVMIGSYPFMDDRGPNTNIVVRSRDAGKLAAAKAAVEEMRVEGRPCGGGPPGWGVVAPHDFPGGFSSSTGMPRRSLRRIAGLADRMKRPSHHRRRLFAVSPARSVHPRQSAVKNICCR